MEPNPDVRVAVPCALHHGGQEWSFSSTEHRHKVSWRPLLTGQLGEEKNKKKIETALNNGQEEVGEGTGYFEVQYSFQTQ